MRLVQSGQHAAAIKLDRQFASIARGGEKAQKAAHDRRQMMDELMAAMPAAERQLLELELEDFAQGRSMDLSGSVGPGAKGKGKATDMSMSMSWEHIAPPAPANGAVKTTIVPSATPIPQRSGAPRFGGPTPAPTTAEEMFPSISRTSVGPQMPKPPSQGPLLFGGFTAQPASTSASAANGWKPKSTANGPPSLFAGIGNGKTSLFDTAGSANAAPNAFYQPPTSAGTKRPNLFGSLARPTPPATPPVSAFASLSAQPVPTSAASASASAKSSRSGRKSGAADTSITGPHDLDVSMLSDLSDSDSARANESASVARALDNSADMDVSGEFSISVFGSAHTRKIATNSGARIARTETEAMLPPGAFLPEDDEEQGGKNVEEESQSVSATRVAMGRASTGRRTRRTTAERLGARDPSPLPEPELQTEPEPEPEPQPAPKKSSARRKVVKDKDLRRSIPGALMDSDAESEDAEQHQHQTEEDEEEDGLAPLPTPSRKPRKSRVSNVVSQAETPRMTRRSSRLSAVSSVGSSSPEPLSPQKPSARARKSTRASMPAASSASASARGSTAGAKTRKKRS